MLNILNYKIINNWFCSKIAKNFIKSASGFEKFAEWGLI